MSSTYDFPMSDEQETMTERERFEATWNKRPWLVDDESDKDRAWRWWRAALEPSEGRRDLPFHAETMDGLNSLKIRK